MSHKPENDTTSSMSIDQPVPGTLPAPIISAVTHEGLSVTTADGRRAHLAVLDADGNVVAAGEAIERAAFEAAVLAYRNFLQGHGHLRVQTRPPGKASQAA